MKKQITIITLGILMLASAMAMYAGDTMTFEVNLTNPVYTVTGNQSSLEGLNITFENGNITISPSLNYKPDNFTIIFFDNITNKVIKTIHTHSSGSSKIKYVDNNVTVYVPKYINNTKIVEVEKINEITKYGKLDSKIWTIIIGLLAGIGIGYGIFYTIKRRKDVSRT